MDLKWGVRWRKNGFLAAAVTLMICFRNHVSIATKTEITYMLPETCRYASVGSFIQLLLQWLPRDRKHVGRWIYLVVNIANHVVRSGFTWNKLLASCELDSLPTSLLDLFANAHRIQGRNIHFLQFDRLT